MKKLFITALLILAPLLFTACSNEKAADNDQEETGAIDRLTTEAADTAVKKIRTPLDKARATQNLGEDRTKAIDQATEGQ